MVFYNLTKTKTLKDNTMKYLVDGWNNFCRVFEIPESYPEGYLFRDGKSVSFLMID